LPHGLPKHIEPTDIDEAVSGADHSHDAPDSFEGSSWGGGRRAQLPVPDGCLGKETIVKIVLISIKFKIFLQI
jgi:hypothetical protein